MTLKQPWDRTILAPFCRSLPEMMLEANQAAEFQRAQALIALRRYDQIVNRFSRVNTKFCLFFIKKKKKKQLHHFLNEPRTNYVKFASFNRFFLPPRQFSFRRK